MVTRDKLVCFATYPKERKAIKRNAAATGQSVSAYVRNRIAGRDITNIEVVEMLKKEMWKTCATGTLRPPKDITDWSVIRTGGGVPKRMGLKPPTNPKEAAKRAAVIKELKGVLGKKKFGLLPIEILDE